MPTDKSIIKWACDLCGGEWTGPESETVAARCESTGAPEALPPGTWYLTNGYAQNWDENTHGGFRMVQLKGHTIRAKHWMQSNPPMDPQPHTIAYAGVSSFEPTSENLVPHKSGVLNVGRISGNALHDDRLETVLRDSSRAEELVQTFAAFGLETNAEHLQRMARDLYSTFDFAAHFVKEKRSPGYRYLPTLSSLPNETVAALRAVAQTKNHRGDPYGSIIAHSYWLAGGNIQQARALALTSSPDVLNQAVERWWAGEDVTVPVSAFEARAVLRSKGGTDVIDETQRDAMTAAGFTVQWPVKVKSTGVINNPRAAFEALINSLDLLEAPLPESTPLFNVPTIIAVASGKGGVGKTTVAAALAKSLTALGKNTLAIDLDFHGPSLGHLLDLPHLTVSDEGKIQPTMLEDGTRALSLAQFLTETDAVVWRGAAVEGFLQFLGARLDVSGIDTIILDLPPGTGEVESAVMKYARPNGAVLVTTGSKLSHADCRRAGRFLQRYDVPILGVVENLSRRTVQTDHGEIDVRLFGEEADTRAFAEGMAFHTGFRTRFAPRYLGSLPFSADPDVIAASPEFQAVTAAAVECAPEADDPDAITSRSFTLRIAVD